MAHIERRALSTFYSAPSLGIRYVDDTFCVIHPDHIEDFHQHLNCILSSIKFTVEHEENNSLAFLDVKLTREESYISTTIFKKLTNTDRYLQYSSHHPRHQKLQAEKLTRSQKFISYLLLVAMLE